MRALLLVFLLAAASTNAQTEPLAIPGSETFTLASEAETYRIHVVLPPNYSTSATPYPVLYYADAWWLTEAVAGIHRIAAISQSAEITPVILVGVSIDGDGAAWNAQRNRDLTPSPFRPPEGVMLRVWGAMLDSTNTGGAPAFADFLRETLMPTIEAEYNARASDRGWLGHSFGGLFGAWALQTQPDLFDRFLLISPSVWWNQGEVVEAGFEARRARVFISYGTAENRPITNWTPRLADTLTEAGLSPTLRAYEGGDHHSVLPSSIWDGLVALYGE
ncbi:MAG: alpha/beta hydrolase-fold protein [Bacteroidota bacterium]